MSIPGNHNAFSCQVIRLASCKRRYGASCTQIQLQTCRMTCVAILLHIAGSPTIVLCVLIDAARCAPPYSPSAGVDLEMQCPSLYFPFALVHQLPGLATCSDCSCSCCQLMHAIVCAKHAFLPHTRTAEAIKVEGKHCPRPIPTKFVH